MERVDGYAKIPEAYRDKVMKQAKFGVAVEQWVEANQVDAVALQCWDSLELNYGCAPCITMSMLSDKHSRCLRDRYRRCRFHACPHIGK